MIHPRFGDLASGRSVKIGGGAKPRVRFQEDRTLIIHLTVTGRCNARCAGCINSTITTNHRGSRDTLKTFEDTLPKRDTKIVMDICRRHRGRPVGVCFYGGEPFLAMDKMIACWSILRQSRYSRRLRFMVYTNAALVTEAVRQHPDFIKDLWLFSVSIDGDLRQHNRSRPGTDLIAIRRALRDLAAVRGGHVLMWSTLREDQSLAVCFEEFLRLQRGGLVDHWYWHWPEIVEPFRDFDGYARQYGRDLDRIMLHYTDALRRGRLTSIIHINELILFLLTDRRRGHTGCAIEKLQNFDIVNGRIFACVDLPAELGDLERNQDPRRLVSYKAELGCFRCGVHGYCGGRCPVQGLYGSQERTRQYCQLMRLHVAVVQDHIGPIRAVMKKHRLRVQDLYDRSAYLTRFTDVTP